MKQRGGMLANGRLLAQFETLFQDGCMWGSAATRSRRRSGSRRGQGRGYALLTDSRTISVSISAGLLQPLANEFGYALMAEVDERATWFASAPRGRRRRTADALLMRSRKT
jgi:hypothetical protein